MPATFAHCLMARKAIEQFGKKNDPYSGVLKMKNNFVVMGATGPDYPYLTDVLKYGVLHIGHNWSNRMHYESVNGFINAGIKALSAMNRESDQFQTCLAWFAGYTSHVVVDSFMHPVINCIVKGIYIFTHVEHSHCELIQDAYIFKKITGTEIINAAPRDNNTFGYLNILDDCSDPTDLNRIHPDIRSFWTDLLQTAHPHASDYFKDINPDEWHKNYKGRIDFTSNSRSIFRHVLDIANAPRYLAESAIDPIDRKKYIDSIPLPDNSTTTYDAMFSRTVDLIVTKWMQVCALIRDGKDSPRPVGDWDLDTGVDQDKIDLWEEN